MEQLEIVRETLISQSGYEKIFLKQLSDYKVSQWTIPQLDSFKLENNFSTVGRAS